MRKNRVTVPGETPVFFDKTGRRWLLVRTIGISLSVLLFFFVMWTVPHVFAERRVPALNPPYSQLTTQTNNAAISDQLYGLAKTKTNNGTAVIGTGPEIKLVKVVVDSNGCYIADPITNKKIRTLSYAEILYIGNEEYAYLRYGQNERITPTVDQLANTLNHTNTAVIGKGPLIRVVKIFHNDSGTFFADPFTGGILEKASESDIAYLDGDRYAIQRFGHTNGKRIALTFDDGPDPIYTPQLLDLLAAESAQASFFVVGTNVARYSEIAERITREGHTIGNHTFSHIDFDFVADAEGVQQINQTQRLIVAATAHNTPFYRTPYGGNSDQSFRNSIRGILQAQRLGYTNTSYDFDSNDWRFNSGFKPEMPAFDGTDEVVLVHDSGGDRTPTLAYVKALIDQAKAKGYTFVNLNELYPQFNPVAIKTEPSFADHVSFISAQAAFVWPIQVIQALFSFSVVMIIVTTLLNVILAVIHTIKARRKKWQKNYRPLVSIIVPAYNEGTVIVKTIRSLLQSNYHKLEILIIDDGSTDKTWSIARDLDNQYKRVRAIRQQNGGKASALNNAIARAKGEIIICVDADTIFPPQTVGNLVRHFHDPAVAAVAGVIKAGNIQNMLTRWQMLEYTVSIAIDRNAHSYLNSIMIIPGACGAWRKSALQEVGGFSHSTLAEDCDMTIKIQQLNRYRIVQENDAISYTEVPDSIGALTKQRFRWMFGNIQALWKHRNMLFNEQYGWLGMFIMPNSLISIIIPLLFWPVLAYLSIQNIVNGNYSIIIIYFSITMFIQFIVSTIGLRLARERLALLWAVPFARFIYGPLRLYILYKTVLTALRGSYVGWNKLLRTGTATYPAPDKAFAALPIDASKLSASKN